METITGSTSIGVPVIESERGLQQASGGIAVTCHDNEVPLFVEGELERLYGNIFSSLAHFRCFGGLPPDTSTYVARKANEIVTILLYRFNKGQVQVLNEGMQLGAEEISRFADTIFSKYGSAKVISFHAVPVGALRLPYPHQRYTCTEDIVMNLPESAEAYLAMLGKNTRRNTRRYMDKLMRAYPSFRYDFYERETIDEQQVRTIIDLSRARIAGKNMAFAIGDEEVDQIVRLAKERGLVGVATIDGRVCGGVVGYLVGESLFLRVISHDPAYNDYSTGFLCCFLTICESISRGCKHLNFMQDGYDYKFAFGAAARNLAHVAIYRSRMQMLLNGRMALMLAVQARARQLRLALVEAARNRDGGSNRVVARVLHGLRNAKRIASGRKGTK